MYYFINRVVTMRTPCSPFTVSSKTTAFFSVVFKSKEYLHNIPDNNKNKQFYLRSTPVNTENCEADNNYTRHLNPLKCQEIIESESAYIAFQFHHPL